MFIIARTHLQAVATTVGILNIVLKPQKLGAGRRAEIFTIPARGVLAQNINFRQEIVERYKDPTDLNAKGEPKIKKRILKADQTIWFAVRLFNTTDVKLNDDFKNFIRNLGKEIYDGQTATRLGEDNSTRVDTKGNIIKIVLGKYNFNDNRYYGDFPHNVVIEIGFEGGIYLATDVDSTKLQIPASFIKPVDKAILTS